MTAAGARFRLADLSYEAAKAELLAGAHALLPVGAVEAHGPHLPLSTDIVIAERAAELAAQRLAADGRRALVLPPIAYSVANFARNFGGTLSIERAAMTTYVEAVVRSALRAGFRSVVFCNAHLEPENRAVLKAVADALRGEGHRVAFPDVVRREHAVKLGAEFQSGACHAGRYETSLVLAASPALVERQTQASLAPNPASLSDAIREGKGSFEEAGGARAYFGWPHEATVDEGHATYGVLAEIFADAVRKLESETIARG